MKIVMITGSPHKHGTSATLAENFLQGARDAGHKIFRFDSAFQNVHPCIACKKCQDPEGRCVFRDDMEILNPQLLEADLVVFATPIFYYAMSGQIKTVIDRFLNNNVALHVPKKAMLLVTMTDATIEAAKGAIASFEGMAEYFGWNVSGILAGVGCRDMAALEKTDYPRQAYEMGRKLPL